VQSRNRRNLVGVGVQYCSGVPTHAAEGGPRPARLDPVRAPGRPALYLFVCFSGARATAAAPQALASAPRFRTRQPPGVADGACVGWQSERVPWACRVARARPHAPRTRSTPSASYPRRGTRRPGSIGAHIPPHLPYTRPALTHIKRSPRPVRVAWRQWPGRMAAYRGAGRRTGRGGWGPVGVWASGTQVAPAFLTEERSGNFQKRLEHFWREKHLCGTPSRP